MRDQLFLGSMDSYPEEFWQQPERVVSFADTRCGKAPCFSPATQAVFLLNSLQQSDDPAVRRCLKEGLDNFVASEKKDSFFNKTAKFRKFYGSKIEASYSYYSRNHSLTTNQEK